MTKSPLIESLKAASEYLKKRIPNFPDTTVVLGSGFKVVVEKAKVEVEIPLRDVPGMPVPGVEGHGSSLLIATLGSKRVAMFSGRVHLYEGFSAEDTVFAVRVAAKLGTKNLMLTNAAGGLNTNLKAGQIISIHDHINHTGTNCLIGDARLLGKQFLDMTQCYDRVWQAAIAKSLGLKSGVYMSVMGPTYETPAETKLYAQMGADMVGMSTVQEAIAAHQMGVRVAAMSFVTNMCGGISDSVDHQEVLDIAQTHKQRLDEVLTKSLALAPN